MMIAQVCVYACVYVYASSVMVKYHLPKTSGFVGFHINIVRLF